MSTLAGVTEGRHVVIVDDLVQTGGTLLECAKVTMRTCGCVMGEGVKNVDIGDVMSLDAEGVGHHAGIRSASGWVCHKCVGAISVWVPKCGCVGAISVGAISVCVPYVCGCHKCVCAISGCHKCVGP